MAEGEQKLADVQGRFMQVVSDGRKASDVDWQSCRLLLSNKRLLILTNEGKQTIPLGKVTSIKSRGDVNEAIAQVSSYLSVQIGSDVYLVAPQDQEPFEEKLYGAILDQRVVYVKHPAVEGGVVQDTGWEKARLKLGDGTVDLAIASGQFVEVDRGDVGTVEVSEQTVNDSQRRVAEIEHLVEDTVVQTHVTGPGRVVAILAGLLGQENDPDADISKAEHEVLMALYSGVSPFKIPDFVGMDVDEIEEIYDELLEEGLLQEVRTRREVSLKPRGRNIASEVIENQ
ncbi:Component of chemotaxis system associated with archaellum, contains CheF-like and HTH domain [Halapricum desulfuricans]|uniref:Taxis protein CheF n=1 Tax=Halapricum desulfuricans TaxID=2841257 RepID=A0A897N8W9_9EURY|nr:CheF family chemotaxis protein [Halapricum desulfuricans]QSG10850.1 Component of chemotaxis system associated with archaellum, contains CheF-like and HTH domain [Halapricum desulfuricans]